MTTEELNEYFFADLVAKHAQLARRKRQNDMAESGIKDDVITKTPITPEDCQNAFNSLEWYKQEIVKIKKKDQPTQNALAIESLAQPVAEESSTDKK